MKKKICIGSDIGETSSMQQKAEVLSLRDRARQGDPLATSIFDLQARVMGRHASSLTMPLDAGSAAFAKGKEGDFFGALLMECCVRRGRTEVVVG